MLRHALDMHHDRMQVACDRMHAVHATVYAACMRWYFTIVKYDRMQAALLHSVPSALLLVRR